MNATGHEIGVRYNVKESEKNGVGFYLNHDL